MAPFSLEKEKKKKIGISGKVSHLKCSIVSKCVHGAAKWAKLNTDCVSLRLLLRV